MDPQVARSLANQNPRCLTQKHNCIVSQSSLVLPVTELEDTKEPPCGARTVTGTGEPTRGPPADAGSHRPPHPHPTTAKMEQTYIVSAPSSRRHRLPLAAAALQPAGTSRENPRGSVAHPPRTRRRLHPPRAGARSIRLEAHAPPAAAEWGPLRTHDLFEARDDASGSASCRGAPQAGLAAPGAHGTSMAPSSRWTCAWRRSASARGWGADETPMQWFRIIASSCWGDREHLYARAVRCSVCHRALAIWCGRSSPYAPSLCHAMGRKSHRILLHPRHSLLLRPSHPAPYR